MNEPNSTPFRSFGPRRIVFTAIGSLGDLHPSLALAVELRARGHDVVVATSTCYQQKVEALGLGFRVIRPDSDFVTDPARMERFMDTRWGTVRIGVELIGPSMRDAYADTLAVSAGADLLVSHPLTAYTTRLVSEKTGIPWASTMITPLGFLSAYDVPIVSVVPTLSRALRLLGPAVAVPLLWANKRATRFLAKPWYQLRREIGLPPTREGNPLLDSHSPLLSLALFSKLLAAPQRDWPANTIATGFPFYDRDGADGIPPELTCFLDAGSPPIVFTLGVSSATVAGTFFENSIAAAMRLGRRVVLVVGKQSHGPTPPLPPDILSVPYAPYSALFPRAAAVVHAGGIGTTGLVMRAGVPSLIVPFAHDQPDNAARAARLGIARTLSRGGYRPKRVAHELLKLLNDPRYRQTSRRIADEMRDENGTRTACDAIERLLSRE